MATENILQINPRKMTSTPAHLAEERAYRQPPRPAPHLYLFIFAAWIGSVLWFNPKLIQLFSLVTNAFEWEAMLFFVVFINIAWLFGIYNLGVILFSRLYKRFFSAGASLKTVPVSRDREFPPVAILYTTCNDFVEASALSCVQQHYPRFTVYICDDSTDPVCKQRIDRFASKFPGRVKVVRRPDRRGFKAGNLNFALSGATAREPFFAIADADELLPPDFIEKLVPHLLADPTCGFVQANHRCNPAQKSALARALGVGIDIHWKWYQPLRNKFGFVMFLGHGALIRRQSWEAVRGFPEIVSEDLAFAIRIRELGWRGKFVEDVTCYEEFPETVRAFRIRHMKWTRGTCEFLEKEMIPLLKSRTISWPEKFDILFPTLNLPLTFFYFLFMINANLVLPFIFGVSQPLTLGIAGSEFVLPVRMLDPMFQLIYSLDFYLITLLTLIAPILCFVLDLWRHPVQLFRFLARSTALYAALSPLSALGVVSYAVTGKAIFLVTGDREQHTGDLLRAKSVSLPKKATLAFKNLLLRSHPDLALVRLLEFAAGLLLAITSIYLFQISFSGLTLAFILLPVMHRVHWENAVIQKIIYLPFVLILVGLLIGGFTVMGMQTVFLGYGFHF